MKRTPLYETHKNLGARLVEFGGWEMPVQYKGVLDEHRNVRTKAGLFDVCHMGEVFVEGTDAEEFVNSLVTNDVRRITDGQCQYAACCYENGTVVDDVIVYRFNRQKFMIVVNASNIEKDFDWFVKNKKGNVTLTNKSDQYAMLALQGPMAVSIFSSAVGATPQGRQKPDLVFALPGDGRTQGLPLQKPEDLKPFHFIEASLQGKDLLISRTGYTGEDGVEIFCASENAVWLWNLLSDAGKNFGLEPAGLGARDSLRLEAALSLYGHEITDAINPLEARLAWIVKLDKPPFIGKNALEKIAKEGPVRKLIGLSMIDSGIPRQGYLVYKGEKRIGVITSGTFSPTLEKAIGLALVDKKDFESSGDLSVEMRGQKRRAEEVRLPFYKR